MLEVNKPNETEAKTNVQWLAFVREFIYVNKVSSDIFFSNQEISYCRYFELIIKYEITRARHSDDFFEFEKNDNLQLQLGEINSIFD